MEEYKVEFIVKGDWILTDELENDPENIEMAVLESLDKDFSTGFGNEPSRTTSVENLKISGVNNGV